MRLSVDHLIRYLALDETLDEAIVAEINRQREIDGSPVQRWIEEMRWKLAHPLSVDWSSLAIGSQEFDEETELPAARTEGGARGEAPQEDLADSVGSAGHMHGWRGLAVRAAEAPRMAFSDARRVIVYAAVRVAYALFWGTGLAFAIVIIGVGDFWPLGYAIALGCLGFGFLRVWKRGVLPAGTVLESFLGGCYAGVAAVAVVASICAFAAADSFLDICAPVGIVGVWLGSLLGLSRGFGLRRRIDEGRLTWRRVGFQFVVRAMILVPFSLAVTVLLAIVFSFGALLPGYSIGVLIAGLIIALTDGIEENVIRANLYEIGFATLAFGLMGAEAGVLGYFWPDSFWPLVFAGVALCSSYGASECSRAGLRRWGVANRAVFRFQECAAVTLACGMGLAGLLLLLLLGAVEAGFVPISIIDATVSAAAAVLIGCSVGLYLGMSRRWLLLIPRRIRESLKHAWIRSRIGQALIAQGDDLPIMSMVDRVTGPLHDTAVSITRSYRFCGKMYRALIGALAA